MPNCIVVGVADKKGGVGKSTGANFIAYSLADIDTKKLKANKRVLLIDADPQASQTEAFFGLSDSNFGKDNHPSDISVIFKNEKPAVIKIFDKDNDYNDRIYTLDFIPSNDSLIDIVEDSDDSKFKLTYKEKIFALKKYIDSVRNQYDYIVIDTQPLFGVLTKSAIIASDILFIPVATRAVDESGVQSFFQKTNETLKKYDVSIKHVLVQPTLHQKVVNDSREVLLNIGNLPRYLSTLPSFMNSKVTLLKEIPQRSIITKAAGQKMFLANYIEVYENNSDNRLLMKQINKIISLIKSESK